MTGVSDMPLALAVDAAGALPSLMISPDHEQADSMLTEFKKSAGHANLLISLDLHKLTDWTYMKMLDKHCVTHIEIFRNDADGNLLDLNSTMTLQMTKAVAHLRKKSKVMIRIYDDYTSPIAVDAYCVKGKESGGKSGDWSVRDLFLHKSKSGCPTALIPYGGISRPDQVAEYISAGAAAVAVGTLFALAKESALSPSVKNKIIQSTASDRKKNSLNQNLLELGPCVVDPKDDWNRTNRLKSSIAGDGNKGFVYLGQGFADVKEIRSAKEIVDYLVSEL